MNLATGIIAALLAVYAVVYFRANVGKYWRVTGRAAEVAALNTLALLVVIMGVITLAWGLSALCFAPGMWRNALAVTLYTGFMSVIGSPLIALATRIVERRYRL